MNSAAAKRYPASAFAAVLTIITEKYNRQELATARMDTKYGQCQFTKKFFSNPECAMLKMLGDRHISNVSEMRELIETGDFDELEEGFTCPINFQDYLLEVVLNSFGG